MTKRIDIMKYVNKFHNHIDNLITGYNSLFEPIHYKKLDISELEWNFERFLNDAFYDEIYFPSDELLKVFRKIPSNKLNVYSEIIHIELNRLKGSITRMENDKYTNFNKLFGATNHEQKRYVAKTNPEQKRYGAKSNFEFETTIAVPIIEYNIKLSDYIRSISYDNNGQSTFPKYFTFDNLYDAIIKEIDTVLDAIQLREPRKEQTHQSDKLKDTTKTIDTKLFVALARKMDLFNESDGLTYEARAEQLKETLTNNKIFDKIKTKQEINIKTLTRYCSDFLSGRHSYLISKNEKINELIDFVNND